MKVQSSILKAFLNKILTNDILKIIINLNSSKAHDHDMVTTTTHDHDMVSIRMFEICDEVFSNPLGIIFLWYSENRKFPSE